MGLFPSSETPSISRDQCCECSAPKGRASTGGDKSRAKSLQGKPHRTQHNWCKCVFTQMVRPSTADSHTERTIGYMEIAQNKIKLFTFCLNLFISAVLHHSYMRDLSFSVSLSLFVAPICQVTESADSCPVCELYPVIIM